MYLEWYQYLLVFGVRVSGYIQYTGVKLIEGRSLDHAFNREYLDSPLPDSVVVMEAHVLDMFSSSIGEEAELSRIV